MKQRLLRLLTLSAIGLAVTVSCLFATSAGTRQKEGSPAAPKYIFIFLADGAGTTHLEIARMYSRHLHGEGLVTTDRIMKEGTLGLLTIHSADRLVSDSAAAATAMTSGCKARNSALGICADGSIPKRVLEIAKEKGMRTGLVTNSSICDASPAAFAAYASKRRDYDSIVDQYLKLEPEILLGGGLDYFIPRDQRGSRRRDHRDLIALFKERGYAYVADKQALKATRGPRVLGLFSPDEMSFEFERDPNVEPSLPEMTEAALRILGEERGFLLFVETELTDTATHLTDVASVIHSLREFDRAVALGYEFYRRHPADTLLLVTSDHDTGGLAFTGYPTVQDLKRIQSIRISFKRASEILGPSPSPFAVDKLMAEHFRAFNLSAPLREAILKQKSIGPTFRANPTAAALGEMVAASTGAHWISSRHTNQPVFVAAMGAGAERFRGYQDNTDFGKHLLALLQGSKSR